MIRWRRPASRPLYIEGPWSHRSVSANGTRFHVAEAGEGPLVLLLHGFPQFWWTWRNQLPSLAGAGFRAVAADLRGYGGSDKPPRGYDLITAASDAAGLIRALGEANAVVVGHDWGGLVAWTLAAYFPKMVRRLAIVSVPHPLRLRAAVLTDPLGQGKRSGYAVRFPAAHAARTAAAGRPRAAGRPHAAGLVRARLAGRGDRAQLPAAMCMPSVAHSALEYHRWFVRSRLRPDGLRYARHMRAPIQAPTLQLHGALDTCVLPRSARGSGRHVEAPYRWRLIEGVGPLPARGAARTVRRRAVRLAGRPRAGAMTPPGTGTGTRRAGRATPVPVTRFGRPLPARRGRGDSGSPTTCRCPPARPRAGPAAARLRAPVPGP